MDELVVVDVVVIDVVMVVVAEAGGVPGLVLDRVVRAAPGPAEPAPPTAAVVLHVRADDVEATGVVLVVPRRRVGLVRVGEVLVPLAGPAGQQRAGDGLVVVDRSVLAGRAGGPTRPEGRGGSGADGCSVSEKRWGVGSVGARPVVAAVPCDERLAGSVAAAVGPPLGLDQRAGLVGVAVHHAGRADSGGHALGRLDGVPWHLGPAGGRGHLPRGRDGEARGLVPRRLVPRGLVPGGEHVDLAGLEGAVLGCPRFERARLVSAGGTAVGRGVLPRRSGPPVPVMTGPACRRGTVAGSPRLPPGRSRSAACGCRCRLRAGDSLRSRWRAFRRPGCTGTSGIRSASS